MADQNNILQTKNSEFSIRELISFIRKSIEFLIINWKLLITASFIGGLLGFTYSNLKEVQYISSVVFTLEEERPNFMPNNFGSQFMDLGSGGGGSIFSKSNLLTLLKSDNLVKEALMQKTIINGENTTLINYFIKTNSKKQKEDTLPDNLKEFSKDQILKIRGIIKLLLAPIKLVDNYNKTSFIQINYTSTNEIFANLFVHKILETTSNKYTEYKTQKTRQSLNLLQNQADSLKIEQKKLFQDIAEETDNQLNLSSTFNIKKIASQKNQFDLQVLTSTLSQVLVNLENTKMSLRKETPLIFIIEDSEYPLNKIEKNKIKFTLFGALTGFLFFVGFHFFLLNFKNLLSIK